MIFYVYRDIGGDMRQACLGVLFDSDSHRVTLSGLEEVGRYREPAEVAVGSIIAALTAMYYHCGQPRWLLTTR
jgi:hypothetical protein